MCAKAAKAVDDALNGGDRRPVLGIPMTFKEGVDMARLPTTWGFRQFKDFVPKEDALVVLRMKSAGAIILEQPAFWPSPISELPRHLRNDQESMGPQALPWRPVGRVGGGRRCGFWTDLVWIRHWRKRVPAHFCGVYAHKPTLGLVPMRGNNPPATEPLPGHGDLGVVGPLARTAGPAR